MKSITYSDFSVCAMITDLLQLPPELVIDAARITRCIVKSEECSRTGMDIH